MDSYQEKPSVKQIQVKGPNGDIRTFFQLACQEMSRFTSQLAYDSDDLLKPRQNQRWTANVADQLVYFSKGLYLVIFGGFVPYYFKVLPNPLFQLWSLLNSIWRRNVLSPLLRLQGYSRLCRWTSEDTQHVKDDTEHNLKPYSGSALTLFGRLSEIKFMDPNMEKISEALVARGSVLAPHSQANPNPIGMIWQIFFGQKFPGNFFDHLIGVWKVLVAWEQPVYICRGGFLHSVYGTNQYRSGIWGYDERDKVSDLIGPAAEQIAFLICSAEREAVLHDLNERMYLKQGEKLGLIRALEGRKSFLKFQDDPNSKMVARLNEDGFPITNHITRVTHMVDPHVFAGFAIVMIADFLEQGVSGMGIYKEDRQMFFSYIKVQFWADVITFLGPYLKVIPPVFVRHGLIGKKFNEPSLSEILCLERSWKATCLETSIHRNLPSVDAKILVEMSNIYPWVPEPFILLAVHEEPGSDKAVELAGKAKTLLSEWGMLHYKLAGHLRDGLKAIGYAHTGRFEM